MSVIDIFYESELRRISEAEDKAEAVLKCFRGVPYENISKINAPFGKLRMPEDIAKDRKLYGLGGSCFSLTWLLKVILDYFGETSRLCLADRNYASDAHCALISIKGTSARILDPGYLIFSPIAIPKDERRSYFSYEKNRFVMDVSASEASICSILPNGETKFRYRLKLKEISDEDFFYAWHNSFSFAMMKYVVVNRYVEDGFIYLKNTSLHVDGKFVKKMTLEETLNYLENIGISSSEAVKAYKKVMPENFES